MLTDTELLREAAASGFRVDVLEKAIRLMELLEALRSHPYLKTRVALKGGTALNLFVFDVPRLSVDVDLNYVGAAEVGTMKQERPKVDQAIQAVCGRPACQVYRGAQARDRCQRLHRPALSPPSPNAPVDRSSQHGSACPRKVLSIGAAFGS